MMIEDLKRAHATEAETITKMKNNEIGILKKEAGLLQSSWSHLSEAKKQLEQTIEQLNADKDFLHRLIDEARSLDP